MCRVRGEYIATKGGHKALQFDPQLPQRCEVILDVDKTSLANFGLFREVLYVVSSV